MAETDELLRILIQLTARQALPEATVRRAVGTAARQVQAYNLCNGSRSQAEVAKAAKLDQGNFSRTVTRWANEGVVFKLGTGREARLLHAYPLTKARRAKA